MRTKLSLSNPEVKRSVKACYPNYRGRRIYFSDAIPKGELRSYWDSGHRNYYCFYQPTTGKKWELGSNHPWFEAKNPAPVCDAMPDSVCLVCHTYAGQYQEITIYARIPVVKQID